LTKALEEDGSERREERERHDDAVIDPMWDEWVLDDVLGRVGGGQRHGDDVVGGGESEQAEDERLAFPSGEQFLEQRDAAFAVRAEAGNLAVDMQRAEQREQHEYGVGNRREQAGGGKRNALLVSERAKVVAAGKTHHRPPGRLMRLMVGL